MLKALSVDPINHHVLELLNLALEANADVGLSRLQRAAQSLNAPVLPVERRKGKQTRAPPTQDVEMSVG